MSDSLEQYINMGGEVPARSPTREGSMQEIEGRLQLERQQYGKQLEGLEDRLQHLQRLCLELGRKIESPLLGWTELGNTPHYDHEAIAYDTVLVGKPGRDWDTQRYEADRLGVEIQIDMQREKEQSRLPQLQQEINTFFDEQHARQRRSMDDAKKQLQQLKHRILGSQKQIQHRMHTLEHDDNRYVEGLASALQICISKLEAQSPSGKLKPRRAEE